MENETSKIYTHKSLTIVLLIIALLATAAAVYFYLQFSNAKIDPQKLAQEEATRLIAQVGKLIVLPENETPTIATVSDPAPLKNQPFFANAKKGDKVLIYTGAKKAILYNPEMNKIVEVAPVNIGPAPTTTK